MKSGTNPFDDDDEEDFSNGPRFNIRGSLAQTQLLNDKQGLRSESSNNPFDDGTDTFNENQISSYQNQPQQRYLSKSQMMQNHNSMGIGLGSKINSDFSDLPDDPIWATRNIEWPIPATLSSTAFRRFLQISLSRNLMASSTTASGAAMGDISSDSPFPHSEHNIHFQGQSDLLSDDSSQSHTGASGGNGGGGGITTGIAGLMSRVLNNNSGNTSNTNANTQSRLSLSESYDYMNETSRKGGYILSSPHRKCVAASNGWIVALTECSYGRESNHDNTNYKNINTDSNKVLRLISRWNVYRGTNSKPGVDSGSGADSMIHGEQLEEMLFPLPQPLPGTDVDMASGNGTIAGIFVDPTGCHTFVSAFNGEAYYLHSNLKRIQKLPGFGPGRDDHDGNGSKGQSGNNSGGISNNNSIGSKRSSKNVSKKNSDMGFGLRPNSYVTAVAWDKERGTEGNSKRILLGTNLGEIYEYNLTSSSSSLDGQGQGLHHNDDLLTISSSEKYSNNQILSNEDDLKFPVMLYNLRYLSSNLDSSNHSRSSNMDISPSPVSGLHFERSQGHITIIAVTSGNMAPTRLYSFRNKATNISNALTSFQDIFSFDKSNINSKLESKTFTSCINIAGSIDFADLKICQDAFAIRTETGIYYGSIDRIGTNTPGNSQYDSGLLSYPKPGSDSGSMPNQYKSSYVPVSMSLTPHHFITLSSDGTITFINRVSQSPIQRVKLTNIRSGFNSPNLNMELIMDVRRPDQVWLRHGQTLMHINSSQEDRNVWRYTLERCLKNLGNRESKQSSKTSNSNRTSTEEKLEDAQFEIAKSQCSNSTQKAVVGLVRAEFHLARGRPDIAAKHFAQAPSVLSPFSNIALRLALPNLGLGELNNSMMLNGSDSKSSGALITYLMDKFRVAVGREDSVQCTMLGAWLVELYLHEKEREKNTFGSKLSSENYLFSDNRKVNVSTTPSSHSASMTSSLKNVKIPSLGSFLANNFKHLDAQTTIRILASHDVKASECSGYAAASGNIKTAVNAALSGDLGKNGAIDALKVLDDAPLEKAEPYYYKHAATLLSRAPMRSALSFLARFPHGLEPTHLLPAFMYYERRRAEVREEIAKLELEHGPLPVESKHDPLLRRFAGGAVSKHVSNTPLSHASLQIQGDDVVTDASGVEISIDKGLIRHNRISQNFIDDDKAVVKYLEGVIKFGCKSTPIYNYLISLYAAMEDEGPLFRFLSVNVPAGSYGYPASSMHDVNTMGKSMYEDMSRAQDVSSSSPLDMAYALRVVIKTGRHFRSAVKLYMGFGLRQQAVELALKVDPALARELARESVEKEERKRLWLMIARNAASDEHGKNKDVVAKVVSVIKDCGSDILSIEDVLPFLPDFCQIDQFKDEICSALTSYSSKIDQYLKEMNECNQACDALRNEISQLRSHKMDLLPTARCIFTHKSVLGRKVDGKVVHEPFYVFPSGFVALEGPLKDEVMGYMNEDQLSRLKTVENELKEFRDLERKGGMSKMMLSGKERQRFNELQAEMDGLIAAECPLTGSIMVDSIDKGFGDSLEEDLRYEM